MTTPNSPEQKLIEALDSIDSLLAYADYRPEASTRHQLAIARSIARSLIDGLAELREKAAQHRWIPIGERLPDQKGYYLIFQNNNEVTRTWFSPQHGFFGTVYQITHWQEQPQPPVIEQKERT